MEELYSCNADFKRYVDRYAKKYTEGHHISVNEALTHGIVMQVAEQYRECKPEDF